MEREVQTLTADWRGIALSVTYCPVWSGVDDDDPFSMAHIEVRGPCPLPITETGFRSHFDGKHNIEAAGGPVPFVLAWLDAEADTKRWKHAEAKARQLTLF